MPMGSASYGATTIRRRDLQRARGVRSVPREPIVFGEGLHGKDQDFEHVPPLSPGDPVFTINGKAGMKIPPIQVRLGEVRVFDVVPHPTALLIDVTTMKIVYRMVGFTPAAELAKQIEEYL